MGLLDWIVDSCQEFQEGFERGKKMMGYQAPRRELNDIEFKTEAFKLGIRRRMAAEKKIEQETDPYKKELYSRYLANGITDFIDED